MARMPRLVVPGFPHHVTQRGNRRLKTFFNADDYRAYVDLIATAKQSAGCDIWAYCLMPNHVHFVIVPEHKDSLASLFKEAHRRYTRRINFRKKWRGHLWQERFHSFVMDETHLDATIRYVELNPVKARLCDVPQDWCWSSVHAHLCAQDDKLVSVTPMLQKFPNWLEYLGQRELVEETQRIQLHTRTGRPLGNAYFVETLEAATGRKLKHRKPGPKTG